MGNKPNRSSDAYLDVHFGGWGPSDHPSFDLPPADKLAGDASLVKLHAAWGEARQAWREIEAAKAAISEDPFLTDAAKLRKLGDVATKRAKLATEKADAAVEVATRERNRIEQTFAAALAPPSDAGEAILAAEIRSTYRELSPADRGLALYNAAKIGDLATVRAVAFAPPSLRLVPEESAESSVAVALDAAFPEERARLRLLDRATETARKAGRALVAHVGEEVDFAALDQLTAKDSSKVA